MSQERSDANTGGFLAGPELSLFHPFSAVTECLSEHPRAGGSHHGCTAAVTQTTPHNTVTTVTPGWGDPQAPAPCSGRSSWLLRFLLLPWAGHLTTSAPFQLSPFHFSPEEQIYSYSVPAPEAFIDLQDSCSQQSPLCPLYSPYQPHPHRTAEGHAGGRIRLAAE